MPDGYPLIVLVKGFDFFLTMFALAALQRTFHSDDDVTLVTDVAFQGPYIW